MKGFTIRDRNKYYIECLFKQFGKKIFLSVTQNATGTGNYAVNGVQCVKYNGESEIQKKAQYVKDNGLGGAAVRVDYDDFDNTCGNGR